MKHVLQTILRKVEFVLIIERPVFKITQLSIKIISRFQWKLKLYFTNTHYSLKPQKLRYWSYLYFPSLCTVSNKIRSWSQKWQTRNVKSMVIILKSFDADCIILCVWLQKIYKTFNLHSFLSNVYDRGNCKILIISI